MIRPALTICLVLVASGCASPPDRDREATPRAEGSARISVDLAAPFLPLPGPATSDPRASEQRSPPRVIGSALVVSPRGRATGIGRADSPLDLGTALGAKSPVRPGGTILLRGGTYKGAFVSRISGTQDEPVVVRSFPGEWAVLDGGTKPASTLDVQGSDVWFRDFEVTKSDPDRTSRYGTNAPPDVSRARWSGVWVEGLRTKLINLVVHDAGDGIGIWRQSESSEVYGCILFNNGWLGADHAWGHGIYAQNAVGTKTIEDNIVFNNFGWGIHAYDRLGPIVGFDIEGNTSFGNGTPAGRISPNVLVYSERGQTDRIALRHNVLYHRPGLDGNNAILGFESLPGITKQNGSLSVVGNQIVGARTALETLGWRTLNVAENLVVAGPTAAGRAATITKLAPKNGVLVKDGSTHRWDHNIYRVTGGTAASSTPFVVKTNGQDRPMSFGEWRDTTGFDGDTDHSPVAPAGRRTLVRPNRYERGRAVVTILNWRGDRRPTVDLSKARLQVGERFEIRDVQNLSAAPIVRGVYAGKPVEIPLTSTHVAQPIGGSYAKVTHTSPEFETYLVLPSERN